MKRFLAILSVLLLLAAPALAAQSDTRVFDQAKLFSSSEARELSQAIAAFQQKTGMDFVVVTSREEHEEASQMEIADAFYERGGFGLDAENSGVCYYIDMYERQEYLSTTGVMQDYMTGKRIEGALDQSNPNLRAGRYADAALAMLNAVETYIGQGIPEGQYRYDIITGERLTARHKALTAGEIGVSVIVGVIAAAIFAAIVHARYKLKGSTYRYDYTDHSDVNITDRRDDYLRTTTTRTRKDPPPSSGGGGHGGGGGGNGSGVHISSGGVSHGGGGRGF